jgi:thymidine phosphorylase
MGQPLGNRLGCASEVRAALDVLAGGGGRRLRELTLELATEALTLAGRTPEAARAELEGKLSDGGASASFNAMVRAHGGDPDTEALPRPRASVSVTATRAGFVSAVDAEVLGWIAVAIGAGRRRQGDEIDLAAGITLHVRIGDVLAPGQPLVTLELGDREVDVEQMRARAAAAFAVTDRPPSPTPLIAARLGGSS